MNGLFLGLLLVALGLGLLAGAIEDTKRSYEWFVLAICATMIYIGSQLVSLWLSLKLVMP